MLKTYAALRLLVLLVTVFSDINNNGVAEDKNIHSANAVERPATTDVAARAKVPLEILLADPEKVAPRKPSLKHRKGKPVEISVFRARRKETDATPCVPKNEKINVCEEKARGNNICGTLLYPQKTVLYIESLGFCTVDDVTNRNHPKASKRVDWFLPANPADETSGEKEVKEIGHPELMVYVISKPKPKAAKKKGRKK